MLHLKSELVKCHYSVICIYVMKDEETSRIICRHDSSFFALFFFVLYKTLIFDSSILFYRYFLSKIRFHDVTFALLRGNVSVATTRSLRFYDVKFAFLYRNGNAD